MKTRFDILNPVSRLGLTLLLSVPILITLDWVSASVMFALLVCAFAWARVPFLWLLKRALGLSIVALLAAVSMALYGKVEGTVWFSWGLITVSERSVILAIAVFLRVLVLGLTAIVLLGSVDATRMADGLAQRVHLPARFVLGVLAAVRMAGLLSEDWRTMAMARRARGLGDTGRLRRWLTMVFALLVLAIRRGTKLAAAMEVRGFDQGTPRTWARPSTFHRADTIAFVLAIAGSGIALGSAVWAGTFWTVLS
ncbi:energy-coupling factor transporter transmembrane component T family protein [Gleimia hominis]|uniref:energy-coupling factor transporter transmembrane component T family protein n=1 Tax=Gleimia hominis TaxID=595468 RepID=UPI000C801F2B|nr:energy-coupling factor transporter transmembrane component T [Gleimia hominis]WIK64516.1 energy-coupling factor transporter transmembrane component T [Gleimia hominis]